MSRRGWVLFTLMSVIWGVPYLLIKVADGGVAVPVLVFTRIALAAALLLPLAIRRGHVAELRRHWPWLLLFACVEIILPWAFLSDAERHLSSSMSGLLIASVPILGVLLGWLAGSSERLTLTRWVGLLAGLGGVALLAGPGAVGGGVWPITEVLLTALGYATGPLIANRKLNDLPGLGVTAVCLGFAAVVYAPAAALTWPSSLPSPAVLASLAGLGAVCTAIAFLLFFRLIAEVGPARALVITYVNPAVAVALGVAVLGEPLTGQIVAAFVLILAGSVLATRPSLPARRSAGTQEPGREAAARADAVRADAIREDAVPADAARADAVREGIPVRKGAPAPEGVSARQGPGRGRPPAAQEIGYEAE